jgi:hypothetical protein
VSKPRAFEVEMAIEKLKRYKSRGTDEKFQQAIQAGGRTMHSNIHKVINFIWNII